MLNKTSKIALVCWKLKQTDRALNINELHNELPNITVRSIYRYIQDIEKISHIFDFTLIETKKSGKRHYKIKGK